MPLGRLLEIRPNSRAKLANVVEDTDFHKNFHFNLLTSSLMRGIHKGEISKLGWLIGLVEHAMWADSLYFLYLLLLSVSKTLASSQPTLWPSSYACEPTWISLEDPASGLPVSPM
jgi:hypothetical protein